MKDRGEEALAILRRLHSTNKGQSEDFAETEYQQIRGQVEFDRAHSATYWEIFTKPSYRKRALYTICLEWCIASSGVLVINSVFCPLSFHFTSVPVIYVDANIAMQTMVL